AQLPTGWSSLGCYTDSTSSRTLSTSSYTSLTAMTPLSCVQFCNAGNYKYAGVEYARVHCDNVIHSPGAPADAGNCNTACTGDPTQACGGSDRIFIYSSSGTVVTPGPSIKQSVGTWVYKGC
ncbi:WSC domain-containing protein, partial [Cyathus striatus]